MSGSSVFFIAFTRHRSLTKQNHGRQPKGVPTLKAHLNADEVPRFQEYLRQLQWLNSRSLPGDFRPSHILQAFPGFNQEVASLLHYWKFWDGSVVEEIG